MGSAWLTQNAEKWLLLGGVKIKGAVCSLGEEMIMSRERSSFDQTLFVFMTE